MSETLSKARAKLEIGIIQPKEGRRALGESSYMATHSALKESLQHTLFVYLMMLQLMMLQLVK
jgi:hypothetical protein